MIKLCKKCLYPISHPLGITFDENQICSGCQIHKEKFYLDWDSKLNQLHSVARKYKKLGNKYDCIIPVTGGNESFFVTYFVKYILKLKPLCVSYNSLYSSDVGHNNLATLRRVFNVDINIHIPSRDQVKAITRASLYKINSMYWHVHAGSTAFPLHVAIKNNIPLIIWGGNESIEQVGMYSHKDNVEMSRRYRNNHHLMGFELDDLENFDPSIAKFNNQIYKYPNYKLIRQKNIIGIYLSNFIPWNQKDQHEFMLKNFQYKVSNFKSTFNGYEHPHCSFYNGIHDWFKYLKHGYGRLLDHLVREIRWNRITTEEAINYIKFFKPKSPNKNIRLFAEFLGIKDNAMQFIIENAKNKVFFSNNDYEEVSLIYKKIAELSNEKYQNSVNKINESYFVKEEYLYENDLNVFSTFKPGYDSYRN